MTQKFAQVGGVTVATPLKLDPLSGGSTAVTDSSTLVVEPDGEKVTDSCECCGEITRRVWGYVYEGRATRAVYYATWIPNKPEHHYSFVVSTGNWEEDASPEQRQYVTLACRVLDGGPQFMVVDGETTSFHDSAFLGNRLDRSQVIGNAIADHVFELIDEIVVKDPRIGAELHPRTPSIWNRLTRKLLAN